jgi:hypothetical protein
MGYDCRKFLKLYCPMVFVIDTANEGRSLSSFILFIVQEACLFCPSYYVFIVAETLIVTVPVIN